MEAIGEPMLLGNDSMLAVGAIPLLGMMPFASIRSLCAPRLASMGKCRGKGLFLGRDYALGHGEVFDLSLPIALGVCAVYTVAGVPSLMTMVACLIAVVAVVLSWPPLRGFLQLRIAEHQSNTGGHS